MPDRFWYASGYTPPPLRIPPLYAWAWRVVTGQGQEAEIARFPMATVPQGLGASERQWKTNIRTANPNQIWLVYQMMTEETTVPGPGHDALRALGDSAWVLDGNGVPATFPNPSKNNLPYKMYDMRHPAYLPALISGLSAVFASHRQFGPVQGFFLDQVFISTYAAAVGTALRTEMLAALNAVIAAVRASFPGLLIVCNGSARFAGANGGVDEDPFNKSRPLNIPLSFPGQVAPRCELLQIYETDPGADAAAIRSGLAAAQSVGASFAAGVTGAANFPIWLSPDFDDVMAAWNAGN